MTTGEVIRRARKARGRSQAWVGKRAGLHRCTLLEYELDHRSPTWDTISQIADALGYKAVLAFRERENGD